MADGEVGRVSLGFELEGGSLGKQINNVAKMAGDRVANVMKSSMRGMGKGMKDVVIPAPKVEKVDFAATQSEIEQLTAVLNNTNAQIEFQTRKLSDLKQAYNETFNEADQNKLMGQILRTEASLLRLTNRSDSTAEKVWKLEDSLQSAGDAAEQVVQPIETIGQKMKKTNPQLTKSDKTLKDVAKSAGLAGVAMSSLGRKTTGMANNFTKGFRRIAKQVLVFAVLYKAIRGLQNYIGSSLRTNDEYAKSLEQIKMNMKTAFAPIFQAALPAINALIKALVTATTYLATFVSALFGKTYKQSQQAAKGLDAARKSMDAYGKSAKKVGQSSIDELNLLDTSTDDGGFAADLATFEAPDLDIDKIQSDVDRLISFTVNSFNGLWERIKSGGRGLTNALMPTFIGIGEQLKPVLVGWKESFRALFEDIVSLGEPLKNWIHNDLIPMWQTGLEVAGGIITGLLDSLLNVFDDLRQTIIPIWHSMFENLLPTVTDFVTQTAEILGGLFDVVKGIFDDVWRDAASPALEILSNIITDTLEWLSEFWQDWGGKLFGGLKDTLDGIKELWNSLWQKALKPIVTKMLEMLTKLWTDHLKGLVKEIGDFVGALITAALDILNKFILPIINWLVKKLGPIVAEVFDGIIRVIGSVLGGIIDAAKGIIRALRGIVEFIAGVFTGDWKRAWNGIKVFMDGIAEAIAGVFKGAANAIIDAFNWVIRQLNRISIDIPSWVPKFGGETFGINIPEIPKLAKGGIVTAPTLAMVGDNPHANVDPEVVAPLSKLQEMLSGAGGSQEVVEALYMIIQLLQDYTRRPVILEANGTQLAKVVDNSRDDRNRRAGRTLSTT